MVCDTACQDSLQQGLCTACGHSSEEDQASDTSGSDTTTVTPAQPGLQRLVIPEPPSGSTQPGGSCWTSVQASSRAGSVQSVNTAALDAAVVAAAAQGQPDQQQLTARQLSASVSPPDSRSDSAAARAMPVPHHPSEGQQSSTAHTQTQQHTRNAQQVVQQQQQQPSSKGDQAQLQTILDRYSALKKQQQVQPNNTRQQQHPGLPPLPTPRQQQQRPRPLQLPQQPPAAAGLCLACSPGQPGRCADCRQRLQQQKQLTPNTVRLQAAQMQVQQWPCMPSPAGRMAPSAALGLQRQRQTVVPQLYQQQRQIVQQEQSLQQHQQPFQHQQQQQVAQAQQQQQQQQPLGDRRWGWWRLPGCGSILLGELDRVRQPLLQMHAAHGDTGSTPQLLQAMAHSTSGGQPGSSAAAGGTASSAAAGGTGAVQLSECWQQLVAEGQRLASPRKPQGQALQQQQQNQQQQVLDLGASVAAGPAAAIAAGALSGADAASSGLNGSTCSKPHKRPWQPKMAPDESNWNQAAFADIQSRYSHSSPQLPGGKAGAKWPRTLPEHSTASFAQLMLLHGAGWPNHLIWENWQAAHPAGALTMFVHMKQGVVLSPGMPGRDLIARTKLKVSLDSRWGDISLVEATLHSMDEILKRCPHVKHIGLASGHDVPVQLIRPGLLLPGVSLFGLYQFGAPEMVTLREAVRDELLENSAMTHREAGEWGEALTFHHQWMVLSREHAAALVHHRREIVMIGRLLHKACCSVRAGMAPDEFIVVTALKQLGLVRSVQRVEVKPHMRYPPGAMLNSYPTFVVFPAKSSPHPVLWTHLEKKVKCQVEKNTGQQYHTSLSLNDCLDLAVERCGIYFRKIEIRQTHGEELVMLLSSLEAMWQGQRKGSTAALKTNSGSTGSGKRRGNKRKQSPMPSNGLTGPTPQTSQDGGEASPASSSAYGGAAAGVSGEVAITSPGPDAKRQHTASEAAS